MTIVRCGRPQACAQENNNVVNNLSEDEEIVNCAGIIPIIQRDFIVGETYEAEIEHQVSGAAKPNTKPGNDELDRTQIIKKYSSQQRNVAELRGKLEMAEYHMH